MPKSYLDRGDPYHCQCAKDEAAAAGGARPLFRAAGDDLPVPLRPEEWLKPYTDETVEALARRGVKKLAIVAPGFSADCLETLEELDVENREIFMEHGGEKFAYIPCLNDSEGGTDVIEAVTLRELQAGSDAAHAGGRPFPAIGLTCNSRFVATLAGMVGSGRSGCRPACSMQRRGHERIRTTPSPARPISFGPGPASRRYLTPNRCGTGSRRCAPPIRCR